MNSPTLSVVIPAFNRLEPLRHTLRSVAIAAQKLRDGQVEVLLVDDGSSPALSEQLTGFDPRLPLRHVRQANQGSIAARAHGLRLAQGDYVQFLDSDDLVHPDKFVQQIAQLEATGADLSYCDLGRATPGADYIATGHQPAGTYAAETDVARFYFRVQPLPHSPLFRRSYLNSALRELVVAPARQFDPAGDVWLYFNLSLHPAKIVKLPAPLAILVEHAGERYSHHWEKLGIAALHLTETFMIGCEQRAGTEHLRSVLGETVFDGWRRLPYDFNREYDARSLALWRRAPRSPQPAGGRGFQLLAILLGPVGAGRLLRRWRGQPYAVSRTLPDSEVERLLAISR